MARRLILDGTVVVRAERSRSRPAGVRPADDVALAAVTVAELLLGVQLGDETRRPLREAALQELLRSATVEDYDLGVARAHAALMADARRLGRPCGAHDLIVAATAAATGRTLLTAGRAARFAGLPGVDVLPVP